MIRHQQAQLQAMQQQQNYTPSSSSAALDDTTPPSERSSSYPHTTAPHQPSAPVPIANPRPRSPNPRNSISMSRQSSRRSRTPSRTASPALRPVSAGMQAQGEGWFGERTSMLDDSAFYQAETQMLTRENQMLRQRIRELGISSRASARKRVLHVLRTPARRTQPYRHKQPSCTVEPDSSSTWSGNWKS